MKRILLSFVVLLISVSALAQIKPSTPQVSNGTNSISALDYSQYTLLTQENKLLKNRKTALIVSTVGFGSMIIGETMTYNGGELTDSGNVFVGLGGIATLVGGIWLVVNEFKLINVQQQINKNLMLQINPNGLVLRF